MLVRVENLEVQSVSPKRCMVMRKPPMMRLFIATYLLI
jgi:hypothetical protein